MSINRRRRVPVWVSVLAVLLGLFATVLGVRALVDSGAALGYIPGAQILGTGWGGRNAGLGIALLVAVALRNPYAYVVAFAAQITREIADVVNAYPSVAGIGITLVFLVVDLLGLVFGALAVRRLNRVDARPEPAAVAQGAN